MIDYSARGRKVCVFVQRKLFKLGLVLLILKTLKTLGNQRKRKLGPHLQVKLQVNRFVRYALDTIPAGARVNRSKAFISSQ